LNIGKSDFLNNEKYSTKSFKELEIALEAKPRIPRGRRHKPLKTLPRYEIIINKNRSKVLIS